MDEDALDRAAEAWLRARYTPQWYIGNVTAREWKQAYEAVATPPEKTP